MHDDLREASVMAGTLDGREFREVRTRTNYVQ
jgi:hypothetical protein